jgi:glyoxylase-like metal-dependent hydrolase (beta-lactamase superfamily II)
MASTTEFSTALGHGIWAIDTGYQRPHFDAAYLMVERGRAAFIDTGTGHSVPRLLDTLEAAGVARDAVDWVIPTHVHLDHAGGSGALMAALPHARLVVHPLGARHLIDPAKLIAGATAVYGAEEVQRSIGTVLPVSAERVLESADGMELHLADRPLRLFDTPGHARHHHCVWDERSRGLFTGDTFGLSYREFDSPQGAWLLPSTTPVQFDPPALRASFERLLALQPDCIYLTHYGRLPASPGPDDAKTLQQLTERRANRLQEIKKRGLLEGEGEERVTVMTCTGGPCKPCDSFVYLGTRVATDARAMGEIKRRIQRAWVTMGELDSVWISRQIGWRLKGSLFTASVLSTMLYNAEVWPIRADELRMLEGTYFRMVRSIVARATRAKLQRARLQARLGSRTSREEKSAELDELTVPQLTALCGRYGLDRNGVKADMV